MLGTTIACAPKLNSREVGNLEKNSVKLARFCKERTSFEVDSLASNIAAHSNVLLLLVEFARIAHVRPDFNLQPIEYKCPCMEDCIETSNSQLVTLWAPNGNLAGNSKIYKIH